MAPLNMCPDKSHQLLVLILIKSNFRYVFLFTTAVLFWQYLLFLQNLHFITVHPHSVLLSWGVQGDGASEQSGILSGDCPSHPADQPELELFLAKLG